MPLSPQWTTVTPFSKKMALVLFALLPFWGFFLGVQYMRVYKLDNPAPVYTPTPNQPIKVASTTPSALQTQLAQCITDESKAAKKAGIEYEPGSILVAFDKETSFKTALSLIETYNLEVASSTDTQTNYEGQHWLVVNVPKEEEWRWTCILKGDGAVKYVDVNRLLNLHE